MRRATGSAASRRAWRARRSRSRAFLSVLRMICSIFLERGYLVRIFVVRAGRPRSQSQDDFIERILDDPLSVGSLEARDDLPHGLLLDHRVDGHPVRVAQ